MARMATRCLEKEVGLAVDDEGVIVFSGMDNKLAAQEETKIKLSHVGRNSEGSGRRLAGRLLWRGEE
jgi:hypothetical protein